MTTIEALKNLVAKLDAVGFGEDPRIQDEMIAAEEALKVATKPIGRVEILRPVKPEPKNEPVVYCPHGRTGWCETCMST